MTSGNPTAGRDPEDLPPVPPARGAGQGVWVGAFLIVGILAVLGALFTLTDAAIFRGRYIVTTNVSNAGGIRRGDPVQMRGVNIGRIQRFKIAPNGVAIRLEIEGEYEIPADSYVELKSSGLLGGMVAEVVPGRSDKHLKGGDTVTGKIEEGVMETSTRIADQAETVLGRMQSLLSKDTVQNVETSSAELRQLLRDLDTTIGEQRRELRTLTASLRRSSGSMERVTRSVEQATAGPELERSLKRLDTLSARMDDISGVLDRSSRSMETVLGRIERGEGSLGKLTHDEALYRNLSDAAANINKTATSFRELAEDIKRQPKKYLTIKVF